MRGYIYATAAAGVGGGLKAEGPARYPPPLPPACLHAVPSVLCGECHAINVAVCVLLLMLMLLLLPINVATSHVRLARLLATGGGGWISDTAPQHLSLLLSTLLEGLPICGHIGGYRDIGGDMGKNGLRECPRLDDLASMRI